MDGTKTLFKKKWRPLQWTLQTQMIFVTLIAVGCSFLAVKLKEAEHQRLATEKLEHVDVIVWYDYQVDESGKFINGAIPTWPNWLRTLLGPHFFDTPISILSIQERFMCELGINVPGVDWNVFDEDLKHLEKLETLEFLDLSGSHITDKGLLHIASLQRLRTLDLSCTAISDAGLKHLATLQHLEEISLCHTNITDRGLSHLKNLRRLKKISLRYATISDAGAKALSDMPTLTEVDVSCSWVTTQGLEVLRRSIRNVRWCPLLEPREPNQNDHAPNIWMTTPGFHVKGERG